MGFGGISIWQLLIVLLIVVLLFGTKKLRNIGTDLGGAIKSFRKSMKDEEGSESQQPPQIENDDKKEQSAGGEVNVAQKDKA